MLNHMGALERLFPCLQAYPVKNTEYRLLVDDPQLEIPFPGKVHQHESDQKGDNALPRQYQHRDTGKDEDDAGEVLEHQDKEANCQMPLRQAFQRFFAAGEIVRGDVDY